MTHLLALDDPLLLQVGGAGESLLARVRLGNCLLLLIPALLRLAADRTETVDLVGLWLLVGATGVATGFYLRQRGGAPYHPWIGSLSSAFDVSGITLALVAIAVLDSPLRAVNTKPTFELYFVAVATAALRLDPRVVLLTTLLAVAEYAALLGFAITRTDLYVEVLRRPTLGAFTPIDQGVRLGLLLLAGGATALLLHRARHLLTTA
ncbi:MAG TPA: hypothetical protein VG712_07625, partial [Gemmatimonadales bacterium]|nr:hypothetical protein [Gemmatimonadales bacterium]